MKTATNQSERIIIQLVDTLPCGMFADTATGFCGRPAWVAYAWQMEAPADIPLWAHLGGCWTIQPICAQCAQETAKLYGVTP